MLCTTNACEAQWPQPAVARAQRSHGHGRVDLIGRPSVCLATTSTMRDARPSSTAYFHLANPGGVETYPCCTTCTDRRCLGYESPDAPVSARASVCKSAQCAAEVRSRPPAHQPIFLARGNHGWILQRSLPPSLASSPSTFNLVPGKCFALLGPICNFETASWTLAGLSVLPNGQGDTSTLIPFGSKPVASGGWLSLTGCVLSRRLQGDEFSRNPCV
ncbi:hypothetical protein B0T19DRAFT_171913 [Cercophora scortea]|uniref:Uncharacterized protein n=1 Tax=Cercophora scortea TaxID=314031 RepID=A0AAE0IME2_9PEZI|nr:hypothetical protein B0T19DRAFT_171913 [Cercophora scortea]